MRDTRYSQDEPGELEVTGAKFGAERFRGVVNQGNAPEDVFAEIGLVLVVILGIAITANIVLAALHLS